MTKYTITGKSDGFGAQYQSIMSGIAYCNHMNYQYIHTPIKILSHNENVELLNQFIGIPPNNEPVDIISKCAGEVHHAKKPSLYYTPEVLQTIRNYYYSTEKPSIIVPDIAIHLRRGDVGENYKKRFTSNKEYIELINNVAKIYPQHKITIFSEGKEEDFEELKRENITFCLNGDIRETFHNLVRAKILILSKSSFSYSAALLNENLVYYVFPFWHKKLNHWKSL